MAGLALHAQASLVRLLVVMAIETSRRRFGPLSTRSMAPGAVGLPVPVGQRKVCLAMIEQHLVEWHDVGITTQVFGVTVSASYTIHLAAAAVKSFVISNVCPDGLVTIQTECVLGFLREGLVAIIASVIKLGMSLRQRTRRQQSLDVIVGKRWR